MKITIEPKIFEMFPDFFRGVIVAEGIDNNGENEGLLQELRGLEKAVRQDVTLRNYVNHPKIAPWTAAFSKFGVNPNSCPPSIASLLKRITNGGSIPFINKLVALFNIASASNVLPCGGDNLGAVVGDLRLGVATGKERYVPLGKPEISERPVTGEIIYYDSGDKKVLCRAWCWRNSHETRILPDTKRVAINIDGMPPFTKEQIVNITNELAEKVRKYCGGTAKVYLLSAMQNEIEV